jgi:hypothetical protein
MSRVISPAPLTAWLDQFQRDHGEVVISSPWFSARHSWQVTIPGHATISYPPDGAQMRADLEQRYPR